MWQGANLRRAIRVRIEGPVTIRVKIKGPITIVEEQVTTMAELEDISLGGLSVWNLPRELTIGNLAQLHFDLPGVPASVKIAGKVVWKAQDRTGFAFTNLRSGPQKAIEAYVTQYADAQR